MLYAIGLNVWDGGLARPEPIPMTVVMNENSWSAIPKATDRQVQYLLKTAATLRKDVVIKSST